jgi:hypothetical protein
MIDLEGSTGFLLTADGAGFGGFFCVHVFLIIG